MEALIHLEMIYMDGNTYTVMIRNKFILDLPNPRKVRINVLNNYLYQANVPSPDSSSEDEGEPDSSNHPIGTTMEEDVVPPPTLPTQYEATLRMQANWRSME